MSGVYRPGQEAPPGTLWGDRRRGKLGEALAGQPGEVLAAVEQIARRVGATTAQVALKWVMSHPEITCAISGADTDEQMAENIGAVGVQLSDDDVAELDRVSGGLRMGLDGPQYAAGPRP